ncbi:MAG TPA: sigma 54-interacting transcriptional regulator [Bryobacteraceae bacterium]|nr:sigma 54-interacting transcriptional regulator [Bryobacteraceae bacterium]
MADARIYPDSLEARYAALLEVTESIVRHRQLADLFGELNQSLHRLVPFDFIALVLCDAGLKTARLHLVASDQPHQVRVGRTAPVEQSPVGVLLKTGEPFYTTDIQEDERFPELYQILRAEGIRSYCALPLRTAQRFLGSVNFGSRSSGSYSPADIEFMQQVAKPVAIAVENVLNYEAAVAAQQELARERDRLRLLLNVNNAVVKQLNARELFKAISSSLRETLDIDYVSMALWDEELGQLRLPVFDYPDGRRLLPENVVLPMDGSPAGKAFTARRPLVFQREEIQSLSPEASEFVLGAGLESMCALPLLMGPKALGTLNVGSRRGNAFAEADVALLTQVAGQISIAIDNAISYRRIEELNAKLSEEKLYLEDEIRSEYQFEEIIGQSEALRAILRQIETVAPTDSTVLIYGETGTGKELLARAIHNLSARRQNTFVKLNCAAIPTGLLESELFGHEKGAFTGAITQRIGRFELAHRGTIFLDEVGEIPLELQPKLLRVLQEREFERLGSARTLRVDARLVAATNRDLLQMVQEKEFRADLYYRLNVFPISVPPLRERPEDVPLLVRYFAQQFARRMNRNFDTIPSEAMEALIRYSWPGNIRELQNLIERAVIVSPGPVLRIPLGELKGHAETGARPVQTLEEAERQHILQALEQSKWVIGGPAGAAARLGLKRSTLQFRMAKLGIQRPR